MQISIPDSGLEVRCDAVDVAIVLRGRTMLRVVEHEAIELAHALQACGRVLDARRAADRELLDNAA